MILRQAVLFDRGRASTYFRTAWHDMGATQPLPANAALLEADGSGNRQFRTLWHQSFPAKRALPFGPLGMKDGTATDDFWNALN